MDIRNDNNAPAPRESAAADVATSSEKTDSSVPARIAAGPLLVPYQSLMAEQVSPAAAVPQTAAPGVQAATPAPTVTTTVTKADASAKGDAKVSTPKGKKGTAVPRTSVPKPAGKPALVEGPKTVTAKKGSSKPGRLAHVAYLPEGSREAAAYAATLGYEVVMTQQPRNSHEFAAFDRKCLRQQAVSAILHSRLDRATGPMTVHVAVLGPGLSELQQYEDTAKQMLESCRYEHKVHFWPLRHEVTGLDFVRDRVTKTHCPEPKLVTDVIACDVYAFSPGRPLMRLLHSYGLPQQVKMHIIENNYSGKGTCVIPRYYQSRGVAEYEKYVQVPVMGSQVVTGPDGASVTTTVQVKDARGKPLFKQETVTVAKIPGYEVVEGHAIIEDVRVEHPDGTATTQRWVTNRPDLVGGATYHNLANGIWWSASEVRWNDFPDTPQTEWRTVWHVHKTSGAGHMSYIVATCEPSFGKETPTFTGLHHEAPHLCIIWDGMVPELQQSARVLVAGIKASDTDRLTRVTGQLELEWERRLANRVRGLQIDALRTAAIQRTILWAFEQPALYITPDQLGSNQRAATAVTQAAYTADSLRVGPRMAVFINELEQARTWFELFKTFWRGALSFADWVRECFAVWLPNKSELQGTGNILVTLFQAVRNIRPQLLERCLGWMRRGNNPVAAWDDLTLNQRAALSALEVAITIVMASAEEALKRWGPMGISGAVLGAVEAAIKIATLLMGPRRPGDLLPAIGGAVLSLVGHVVLAFVPLPIAIATHAVWNLMQIAMYGTLTSRVWDDYVGSQRSKALDAFMDARVAEVEKVPQSHSPAVPLDTEGPLKDVEIEIDGLRHPADAALCDYLNLTHEPSESKRWLAVDTESARWLAKPSRGLHATLNMLNRRLNITVEHNEQRISAVTRQAWDNYTHRYGFERLEGMTLGELRDYVNGHPGFTNQKKRDYMERIDSLVGHISESTHKRGVGIKIDEVLQMKALPALVKERPLHPVQTEDLREMCYVDAMKRNFGRIHVVSSSGHQEVYAAYEAPGEFDLPALGEGFHVVYCYLFRANATIASRYVSHFMQWNCIVETIHGDDNWFGFFNDGGQGEACSDLKFCDLTTGEARHKGLMEVCVRNGMDPEVSKCHMGSTKGRRVLQVRGPLPARVTWFSEDPSTPTGVPSTAVMAGTSQINATSIVAPKAVRCWMNGMRGRELALWFIREIHATLTEAGHIVEWEGPGLKVTTDVCEGGLLPFGAGSFLAMRPVYHTEGARFVPVSSIKRCIGPDLAKYGGTTRRAVAKWAYAASRDPILMSTEHDRAWRSLYQRTSQMAPLDRADTEKAIEVHNTEMGWWAAEQKVGEEEFMVDEIGNLDCLQAYMDARGLGSTDALTECTAQLNALEFLPGRIHDDGLLFQLRYGVAPEPSSVLELSLAKVLAGGLKTFSTWFLDSVMGKTATKEEEARRAAQSKRDKKHHASKKNEDSRKEHHAKQERTRVRKPKTQSATGFLDPDLNDGGMAKQTKAKKLEMILPGREQTTWTMESSISGGVTRIMVNPGDPSVFPVGSQVCKTWQRYDPRRSWVHFIYTPIAGAFSTANKSGDICMAWASDPADQSPLTQAGVMKYQPSVLGRSDAPLELRLNGRQFNMEAEFIRRSEYYEGRPAAEFDVGALFVGFQGNETDGAIIGILSVEYEFYLLDQHVASARVPVPLQMAIIEKAMVIVNGVGQEMIPSVVITAIGSGITATTTGQDITLQGPGVYDIAIGVDPAPLGAGAFTGITASTTFTSVPGVLVYGMGANTSTWLAAAGVTDTTIGLRQTVLVNEGYTAIGRVVVNQSNSAGATVTCNTVVRIHTESYA